MKDLPENDALKQIVELQAGLQERLGRLPLARSLNLKGKSSMIIEEVFHVNTELSEMMEHLPFKHWKNYPMKNTILTEERRADILEEYIDAFHFFLNIGLVLGFTAEDIYECYKMKNAKNHKRQDKGY